MPDYYDNRDSYLSQEEVLEIQEEYRQKRIMESIIGPMLSTLLHISLIGLLAYFIQDTYKKNDLNDAKVTIVEDQPISPLEVKPDEPEILMDIEVIDPKLTRMTVEIEATPEADSALEDTNDDIPQTDDNLNMEEVTDVTVSNSNMFAPSMGGRDPGGRVGMVTEMGGTPTGQIHLEKALKWLQKVQNPNGSWDQKISRRTRDWRY